jgi:hypothetical protein
MIKRCQYCGEQQTALKNHIRLSSGDGHDSSGTYPDDFEDGNSANSDTAGQETDEDDSLGPVEKSRELVAKVEDLGLQPYEAPDPLPELKQEDEVKLVCWMAVTPKETRSEQDNRPSLMSQSTL